MTAADKMDVTSRSNPWQPATVVAAAAARPDAQDDWGNADEWLPEMIAGSDFDPSPIPADDTDVPEPATLSLLLVGGCALLTRRRGRAYPKASL